jgi:putative membrane protein (TIGR04086 family)
MEIRQGRSGRGSYDQPHGTTITGAILRGIAAAFLVALVASAVVAVVLASTQELRLSRSTLLLLNYLSVVTGGLIGGRSAKRRGWLVGLIIGLTYALVILAFSPVRTQPLMTTLQGLLVTSVLGLLAGTVGVNL